MTKPDVIVCWPSNCDYPLWRQFIRDNRSRFNEVFIGFMNTNVGSNFIPFIKDAMFRDYVHFVDPVTIPAGQDWRNITINACLRESYNAEWIWFTEQDFIITDPEDFWQQIDTFSLNSNVVIGASQGARLHPCCIFIHRDQLNKTTKNFGIVPDKLDHFGLFQQELEDNVVPIGHLTRGYKHLNGLSHNMHLLYQTGSPNYEPEEFRAYLKQCLKVTVPLENEFRLKIAAYLAEKEPSSTPLPSKEGVSQAQKGGHIAE